MIPFDFIIPLKTFFGGIFLMNDKILWAKTLLSVYRYLERITGAIDKIIMKRALGSANISGQNFYKNNVLSISNKIIDLSQRKVNLINLKVLIDQTLTEIPNEDAVMLIEKYFDGVKARELVEIHNISMRTVFRKLDSSLLSFANKLSFKGYSPAKLQNWLSNEQWILNSYIRLQGSKEDGLEISNKVLEKEAAM